jgi:maltose alpha-D-glucosyltransferase/alpha-amylase
VRKLLLKIRDQRFSALRMRVHGDLNLRQALFTGKDFVIIDFEGDPALPISERRIKRCPLRDVASMLRSFFYASHAVLYGQVSGVVTPQADGGVLERWADFWYAWVGAAYLAGYLGVPGVNALLPSSRDQVRILLDVFLIEKGMREVRHELNERPAWLRIPVHGILELLDTE